MRALRLRPRGRAGPGPRQRGPLACRPGPVAAGWRAAHAQGEHRHQGRAPARGHRGHGAGARGRRRPARRPAARGRLRAAGQDHHARLRHADLGAVELSPPVAQPLEPGAEPRRQQCRRGRGGGGRLWPAARGHRHRRLHPPARRAVRSVRLEAQSGAHSHQAALRWARGRADDAHRHRRRADDAPADPARLARHHQPAGAQHRLGRPAHRTARPAHRPAAGGGLGPARRRRDAGGGAGRRARLRGGRRHRRAAGALLHPRHGRRHGPLLAHALVPGHERLACGTPGQGAALHPPVGGHRGNADRGRGLPGLQPDGGAARRGGGGLPAL